MWGSRHSCKKVTGGKKLSHKMCGCLTRALQNTDFLKSTDRLLSRSKKRSTLSKAQVEICTNDEWRSNPLPANWSSSKVYQMERPTWLWGQVRGAQGRWRGWWRQWEAGRWSASCQPCSSTSSRARAAAASAPRKATVPWISVPHALALKICSIYTSGPGSK